MRAVALLSLLCLAGCSSLYPPVETAPPVAPAPPPGTPPPPPRGARIQLFSADDPGYEALAGTNVDRSLPDAAQRLVVLQDGRLVLDLGIRLVSAEEQATAQLREQVALADDASAAVILRIERKQDAPEQTNLTWLPAEDPGKAWKKAIPPGNRVTHALPLPRGRGLVLVREVPNAPDDLRVYDATGAEAYRLAGPPGRVIELRATDSGRFVGADLAYTPQAGSPDRGVWVHDVAARTAWTHSWKYGDDQEVTAWKLLEDGTLEAETAQYTLTIGAGDRELDKKKRLM